MLVSFKLKFLFYTFMLY